MSRKPINKDKILFWVLCSCMGAIVIMMVILFVTFEQWSPKFRAEYYGEEWPPATEMPIATAAPTEKLTVTPSNEHTPTLGPTEAPTVVLPVEATPTVAPVPTATSLPTSTPTPEPTSTPTPVVVNSNMTFRVQMGDNVWYEYYEDGTLVVTGTGSTWEFDDTPSTRYKKSLEQLNKLAGFKDDVATSDYLKTIKKIIISEGITGIGSSSFIAMYNGITDIYFPNSLTYIGELAFYACGGLNGLVTLHNLDTTKVTIAFNSFTFVFTNNDEEINLYNHFLTPTPTPLPTATPTPTPLPNPEKPRLCHSFKMGDNVTYEFYDNGYLYIKGSGKVNDKGDLFSWNHTFGGGLGLPSEFRNTIKYIVVEEGVTYLGKNSGSVVEEIWLPKSLTGIGKGHDYYATVVHCYKDGKLVTITSTETDDVYYLFEALTKPETAKKYNVTITEE